MFPRREFTAEDLNRTLLELELVPSASVVLRPVSQNQLRLLFGLMRILLLWFHRTLEFPQSFSAVPPLWKRGLVWVCLSPPLLSQQLGRPAGAVVQSSGRGLWAALGTLLYPLLAVWRFLSSFLFATPAPSAAPPRASPPEPNTHNQPPSSSDKAKR